MILFSTFKLFTMIKEQIRTITDAWSSQGMLCHRPKDVQAKVTMLEPRLLCSSQGLLWWRITVISFMTGNGSETTETNIRIELYTVFLPFLSHSGTSTWLFI